MGEECGNLAIIGQIFTYMLYLKILFSKSTTTSFIHEFQPATTPKGNIILEARFDVDRDFYNAGLAEALARLTTMRSSNKRQAARKRLKRIEGG